VFSVSYQREGCVVKLQELDNTPAQHVIEAAIVALSHELGIDDPTTGAQRLVDLSGVDLKAPELEAALHDIAESAMDDVVEALRLVLAAQDSSAAASGEVRKAIDLAGRKQIVITPDMLYTAALLAVCAVAALRPPKGSEDTRVTIEEEPNGKKKVVINKSVKYFSPFSPLIKLIERLIGGGPGA
jgi:hypothetical protein